MSSGKNYRQRGVKVKPQSTLKIRRLACNLRQLLEIREAKIDVGELLEVTLHNHGVTFHVDDPNNPDLAYDEDACAFPDRNLIVLTQHTYDGICRDEPRARFTLLHEVGHILMHGSDVQGLSRGYDPSKPHKPYCDSEWQADTFSAEFLMPANLAEGMAEHEIMDTFGVSFSAARIRRINLEKKDKAA